MWITWMPRSHRKVTDYRVNKIKDGDNNTHTHTHTKRSIPTCQQRGLWEWTQTPRPKWAGWTGWLYSPLSRTATPLTGSGSRPPERRSPAARHLPAPGWTWTGSARCGWTWQSRTSWWGWCCRSAPTRWSRRKQRRWPRRWATSSAPSFGQQQWRCATRSGEDAPSLQVSDWVTAGETVPELRGMDMYIPAEGKSILVTISCPTLQLLRTTSSVGLLQELPPTQWAQHAPTMNNQYVCSMKNDLSRLIEMCSKTPRQSVLFAMFVFYNFGFLFFF